MIVHLEHTELLADVRQTLGLLGLVVNHVESHSLGQRSIPHEHSEHSPALTNGDNVSLLHVEARRAVSRDVAMSLLITTHQRPPTPSPTVCTS